MPYWCDFNNGIKLHYAGMHLYIVKDLYYCRFCNCNDQMCVPGVMCILTNLLFILRFKHVMEGMEKKEDG